MTVGLKDLPHSYLPGGGLKRLHSSMSALSQFNASQARKEGVQDPSAKHRASQLDWTTVLPRACLSLPFLFHCTALWGSPSPAKDPVSLISSALRWWVIVSHLQDHFMPYPPVNCSPKTGISFPQITQLTADLPTPVRVYSVVIMFTLWHPALRMAGACSGIQEKWRMLPPSDSM